MFIQLVGIVREKSVSTTGFAELVVAPLRDVEASSVVILSFVEWVEGLRSDDFVELVVTPCRIELRPGGWEQRYALVSGSKLSLRIARRLGWSAHPAKRPAKSSDAAADAGPTGTVLPRA